MQKQSTISAIISLFSLILLAIPSVSFAKSTSFEVSGWLPYWRSATSTTDALNHLDTFSEVDPFVYTVKSDGTLKDNGGLDTDPWKSFIATAQAKKIRVIPTIMWSDPDAMHRTFSNTKLRQAFATNIAQVVKDNTADAAASSSLLYAPVGDPAWIEKVIQLTLKDINKRKISIGVPTYGYEYDVTAYANNQYLYDILWTFNPGYATQIENQYSVTPSRNSAGEMFLTYKPIDSTSSVPVSSIMNMAQTASAAASLYATTYNSHLNFRMLEWPDGESLRQKIALAHKYGLRGVSIFKIDGGEDPTIWDALKGVKTQ